MKFNFIHCMKSTLQTDKYKNIYDKKISIDNIVIVTIFLYIKSWKLRKNL